jgi:hypothetical protein
MKGSGAGNYVLGSLPIGQYTLTYEAAGFKELSQSGLALTSGQIAKVGVLLEFLPGGFSENSVSPEMIRDPPCSRGRSPRTLYRAQQPAK